MIKIGLKKLIATLTLGATLLTTPVFAESKLETEIQDYLGGNNLPKQEYMVNHYLNAVRTEEGSVSYFMEMYEIKGKIVTLQYTVSPAYEEQGQAFKDISQFPLIYQYDGVVYYDVNMDGINGNEKTIEELEAENNDTI